MGGRKEFHRWKETLESSSMSHWFQMSWHTCVYTCMCVCIHVYIYVYIYVYMYVSVHDVCVCTLKIQKLKLKFNDKCVPISLLFY